MGVYRINEFFFTFERFKIFCEGQERLNDGKG